MSPPKDPIRKAEAIRKAKETFKRKFESGLIIPSQRGRKRSPERRKKISETLKKKFASGELVCPWKGKKRSEEYMKKHRIHLMNINLFHKNTKPEVKLQEELKRRNIKFDTHKNIENICRPDIIIPEVKLIVQVDGDYWHDFPNGLYRDHLQDKQLREKGWDILRLWEGIDINGNIEGCGCLVEQRIATREYHLFKKPFREIKR